MTMRIFRDSVTPARIPLHGTDGVLAYVNGGFAWSPAETGRFTEAGKQVARIDVDGTAWRLASILDVEKFDATPETAAEWIRERNDFRPDTATVYVSRAGLDALFRACHGLDYWLLVADWTGAPHRLRMPLPPGVRMAGTQYASVPGYDVSAVYASGWHRA